MSDPTKTMTADEWARLAYLANDAARATTNPHALTEAYLALAEKCLVRGEAAREGRCMP